jgi:RHS repeat-associated protein
MNNRWRYAGKETQRFGSLDLSLLDFGARMYDPFIARWTAADPMAKGGLKM